MVDTFFGPSEKSSDYWSREWKVEGRTRNDEMDRKERRAAHRNMIASGNADCFDHQMHADLWKADGEDKAHWRAHFQKTGELLTPAQHHRLDEPGSSNSIGLHLGRELLAGLVEEYGAEGMEGATIIVPSSESDGSHVQRETRRAEKRLERTR